jgi:hypothetical protein
MLRSVRVLTQHGVLLLCIMACDAKARSTPDSLSPDADSPALGADSAAGAADTLLAPADPATDAGPDLDAALLAAWRARIPAQQLVRPGACPFECCTYGNWIAGSEIPLRASADHSAAVFASMATGQPFRADSGKVVVTSLRLIAMKDTITGYLGDAVHRFVAGDTLVLLDPIGEGHFNVWYRGRVLPAEGIWDPPNDTLRTARIGRHAHEWWVHATLPDARRGWFLADSVRLRGADACGGPL